MEESEQKLLIRLEENLEWPNVYMFKFIFKQNEETLNQVSGAFGTEAKIVVKNSKGGKYCSFTATELMLTAIDVIERYRHVGSIKGVISL